MPPLNPLVLASLIVALPVTVFALDRRPWWVVLPAMAPLVFSIVNLWLGGFRWKWLPVYLLSVVLAIVVLGVVRLLPLFRLPEPRGPFAVGTVERTWLDPQRNDRSVPVQIWYPADPTPTASHAPYLTNPEKQLQALPFPSFLLKHLGHVQTQSLVEAPIHVGDAPYPVLLFSYGVGGNPAQNTFQFQELASHGYIVVSIDHGFSFDAYNIDPRTMTMDALLAVLETRVLPQQAADQGFVVDQLEAINNAGASDQLAGMLDLSRLGVFGHSGGGSTGLLFCSTDARPRAMLNLDGNILGEVRQTGITQPYLHLSQHMLLPISNDELAAIQPSVRPLASEYRHGVEDFLQATRSSAVWLRLQNSGHFTFTDAPFMFPIRVGPLRQMLGTIDNSRSQQVINAYTRAFFDAHLKGIASPLLEGPSSQYPEMQWIAPPDTRVRR